MFLYELDNINILKKEYEKIFNKLKNSKFSFEEGFEDLKNKIFSIPTEKLNSIILTFSKNNLANEYLLLVPIVLNDGSEIISFRGIEFYLCKYNNIYFLENYTKIKNPNPQYSDLIPFKLYEPQKRVLNIFKEHKYLIIRKSRQIGFSTIFAGYCIHQMNFFKAREFPILSKDENEAMGFKEKAQIIYDSIPGWLKTKYEKSNEHELKLVNYSSLIALSSSKEKGRSKSATTLIIDEAAFITHIDTIWKAAFPVISQSHGNVVVLSTVNGTGNWYYKKWVEAEEGKNDFYPLFIKWWEVPERDNEWLEQYKKGDLSFLKKYNCNSFDEFISKIENGIIKNKWVEEQKKQLGNDGFRQEVLAEFIVVGDTVLKQEEIKFLQSQVKEPILKNPKLFSDILEKRTIDGLWVWKTPEKDNKYVFFADVGTGRAEDFSTIEILNINTNEQVAEYQNIINTYSFAKIINLLARYYNNALVIIESNASGLSVLTHLLNEQDKNTYYDNVYYENVKDGVKSYERTSTNRGLHLDQFINSLLSGEIKIYSERLVNEFRTFIWTRKGLNLRAEHSQGNHDDLILAFSIYSFFKEKLKYRYTGVEMLMDTDGNLLNYNKEKNEISIFLSEENSNVDKIIKDNEILKKIYEDLGEDAEKFNIIFNVLKDEF